MLSRTGIHALTALATLASLQRGEYLGASELARRIGAPKNYLGKLLQSLAVQGILQSQKGKRGGFRLARPAEQISLYEVIEPIERVSRWSGCFLGRAQCSAGTACPVHHRWGKVRDAYLEFLNQTTVADLTGQSSTTPK